MSDIGIYIVTIRDVADTDRTIVKRVEETDHRIETLALQLEALVEHGIIDSYSIVGVPLAPLVGPMDLFTEVLNSFWHADISTEAKDGIDAILYDSTKIEWWGVWDHGWQHRDAYFHRNAKANIR